MIPYTCLFHDVLSFLWDTTRGDMVMCDRISLANMVISRDSTLKKHVFFFNPRCAAGCWSMNPYICPKKITQSCTVDIPKMEHLGTKNKEWWFEPCMLHGAGIFTYKTGPFLGWMQVKIPAPWFASGNGMEATNMLRVDWDLSASVVLLQCVAPELCLLV